jgi:calcineurin-like phosphoesterase
MQKIAIIGQLQHELQASQVQQLTNKITAEAGTDCIIFANASGMFATSSSLNNQVELLLSCGISALFLGEAALQRAAARRALSTFPSKTIRPLNISEPSPSQGALLLELAQLKLWLLSVVDHSGRIYSEPAHLHLEAFFKNKTDDYPVFININGTNTAYKTALAWWLKDKAYEAFVFGNGLGYPLFDSDLINSCSEPLVLDTGAVVVENTIDGLSPKTWWDRHVERRCPEFLPEWGHIKCDYILFDFCKNKKIQNCLHKSIKI